MNSLKKLFLVLIFFLSVINSTAQEQNIFAYWDFEANIDSNLITEKITGNDYRITGLAKFVPGVKGSAIKFDGFSSYLQGNVFKEGTAENNNNANRERIPESLSIEAWVSLGAYPWNWAPILTVGKYKITGFYFGIDSRGCPGLSISDGTSTWHQCKAEVNPETKVGMELRKWYHVVATYAPGKGMALYINGELVDSYNDFQFNYGIRYSQLEDGFRMGMNREDLAPTDPVREWATFPSRYTLDGIVDELKIHSQALDNEQVKMLYQNVRPENLPEFADRSFPQVKPSGRFGANYTRLEFYPEWDAIWPVGDHMDVVVQFDELPIKTMFWRGARYSACWVSENGKWMADQSRETGNNWFLSEGDRDEIPTGCMEHMSDVQCRSSRVSIIESNDARVVVNWRYLQMDVKFRQNDLPNNTGFGEWGNELYYIYPDGAGIRKVLPGRGGWQETIFFNEPGTRPEDNVELEACRLMNLEGESRTYSWEHGYPKFDLDGAVIQVINFKSDYKPFLIVRKGGGFRVFSGEVRPEYSHFPWWNHWPVAQISSDGRSAYAPDRAAHSSLSWGRPNGMAALYGMTNLGDDHLLGLARSWNDPPELKLKGNNFKSMGYDYTQRAYILENLTPTDKIEFTLDATAKSPVYNPAFVVKNWQGESDLNLKINGKEVPQGSSYRKGLEYQVDGSANLVIWVNKNSEKPLEFLLTR